MAALSAAEQNAPLSTLRTAVPAEKPTLHDIAAMPYPVSEMAVRQHYDPHWGKYTRDGETAPFKVEVEYTYRTRGYWECEVQAVDEAEAEKMAMDQFDDAQLDCNWNEFEDVASTKVTRA